MNDITPAVPKPIVASSRTTQEWILDKPALSQWLQHMVENTQLSYGITKREFEPGFCRYTLDYEKMAALNERMIEQMADKGLIKGLDSVQSTGHSNEAGLEMILDLDALFNSRNSHRLEVLGVPEPHEPTSIEGSVELIRKSLVTRNGSTTLYGEDFLRGLKGLADTFNAIGAASTEQFDAMHSFEKQKIRQQIIDKLQEVYESMGVRLEQDGSKLKVSLRYDDMVKDMEKHTGPDRGLMLHRNGDGTADVTVDYARLIDLAAEKAHIFVAEHSKNGKSEIMHDTDSIKVTLSTGGLDGLWNGLVQKISEGMLKGTASYQGTLRDNLGTVAQLPKH